MLRQCVCVHVCTHIYIQHPQQRIRKLTKYNTQMATTTKAQPDGLFHTACLKHSVPDSHAIEGQRSKDILTDWFFELNALTEFYHLVEQCPVNSDGLILPCQPDPSCAVPSVAVGPTIPPCAQSCYNSCVGSAGVGAIQPGSDACTCLETCDLTAACTPRIAARLENAINKRCGTSD